jgi:hypothetical protein
MHFWMLSIIQVLLKFQGLELLGFPEEKINLI